MTKSKGNILPNNIKFNTKVVQTRQEVASYKHRQGK